MSSDGSISRWIDEVKSSNEEAAQVIWDRYFPDLVRIARRKLEGIPGGMADEEDVALSALDSFCRAAEGGRFPDLADRHDLFRLLSRITKRKAVDLIRHYLCEKDGGGRVRDEAGIAADSRSGGPGLAGLAGDDPIPEIAAILAEECQKLLDSLEDPELKELALARVDKYTNQELSERFHCSIRTIERRFDIIRQKWSEFEV
jgi:DNA-directed RNA polymerase specialized sigma24 family protein